MKKKTASGCIVTYAPFWLVWIGPGDGGPERFPHIRVTRPESGNGEPLSESEALSLWLSLRTPEQITATSEAQDYLSLLRNH